MLDINAKLFGSNGQLSLQAIALYVDAMKLNRVHDLPAKLYQYVHEHPVELAQIAYTFEIGKHIALESPHPYFDEYLPQWIDLNLKEFLQQDTCEPYQIYEQELETVYRNNTLFKLISPNNGDFANKQLVFSWQGAEEVLELQIQNNDLEDIYNGQIKNNSSISLTNDLFGEGLYYFKIIQHDVLLKMGKFYVYRQHI